MATPRQGLREGSCQGTASSQPGIQLCSTASHSSLTAAQLLDLIHTRTALHSGNCWWKALSLLLRCSEHLCSAQQKSNQPAGAFYHFFFFPFLQKGCNSQLWWLLPHVTADCQVFYYVIIWFSCRRWGSCTISLSNRNTDLWAKSFHKITLYSSLDFITPMFCNCW